MASRKPLKFIIEVEATRTEGPVADPDCYPDELEALLDGETLEVADPDKEDVTLVSLSVTRVIPAEEV